MTDDEDQPTWAANTGLAEDTERVFTYPPTEVKNEWEQAADEQGFSSLSKYVYHRVEEARAYRANDVRGPQQAEQRIQELQTEVERLREQFEKEQQKSGGRPAIDDIDFLEKFLTGNYQPLEEILQQIVESGVLNELIRKRVEDQLYFLAGQDRVTYERGWGWKLTDNGGDE